MKSAFDPLTGVLSCRSMGQSSPGRETSRLPKQRIAGEARRRWRRCHSVAPFPAGRHKDRSPVDSRGYRLPALDPRRSLPVSIGTVPRGQAYHATG
jgi:hypothetical protein